MNKLTDLQVAKESLPNHTIALCKSKEVITDTKRGIFPMMRLISSGKALKGYSVADLIVGKAVAMLFVKAGIIAVYGATMSVAGKQFLTNNNVFVEYDNLVEKIENRTKTGTCPMEMAVANIEDVEKGYEALQDTIKRLAQK